jgi:hypothetical protein
MMARKGGAMSKTKAKTTSKGKSAGRKREKGAPASPAQSSHPLVVLVTSLLRHNPKEPLVLSREARPKLEAALRAYFGKPELFDAVRELSLFAVFLATRQSSVNTARQLLEVAAGMLTGLRAVDSGAAERVEKDLKRARRTAFGRKFVKPEGPLGGGLPQD